MTEVATNTPTVSLSEALAFDLRERRNADLKTRIRLKPQNNPRLSDIGECDRQICYSITNWADRSLHSEELQARFDAGNLQEREIIRELHSLGYKVKLQQKDVEIKDRDGTLLARGHIDGMVDYHGVDVPFEIKSMHPVIFNRIESIEDFRRKPLLRKYIRQMQMYLYGNNLEEGIFILTDCLGHWLPLPIHLDLGECEQILQRLERISKHLKEKTLPERIVYQEDVCGRCAFAHVCLADVIRTEAEVLTDDTFLELLAEREANAPAHERYEEADHAIKRQLKDATFEKAVAGDFLILRNKIHRNGYTVHETDYWKTQIRRFAREEAKDGNQGLAPARADLGTP